jgi:hypothetical protein
MYDKISLILLIAFIITVLATIVLDRIKNSEIQLRYNRVWPFFIGALAASYTVHSFIDGKPQTIIFSLVLDFNLLYWAVLRPLARNK